MGCNYYIYDKSKKCKCCGRGEEEIHIGKSSGGWKFLFNYNGGKYYADVDGLKKFLKNKTIYSEDNERVSKKIFWEMVEEKQKEEKHHYADGYVFRLDGYDFLDSNFS